MKVLIQDFSNEFKFYACNFDSAEEPSIEELSSDQGRGIQGFGSWERLKTRFSRKKFVAVFLIENRVFIFIENRIFPFSDSEMFVKVKSSFLGQNEIELVETGKILLKVLCIGANSDPEGVGGNIFEFIERFSLNAERKAELLKILTSLKEGEFKSNWRNILQR